jgi:hypothetical protein
MDNYIINNTFNDIIINNLINYTTSHVHALLNKTMFSKQTTIQNITLYALMIQLIILMGIIVDN